MDRQVSIKYYQEPHGDYRFCVLYLQNDEVMRCINYSRLSKVAVAEFDCWILYGELPNFEGSTDRW